MSVNASDEASGRSQSITITADKAGKLSRRDVERLNADAEAHASDDAAALDKARARNDLEGACYSARSTLSKHASDVDVSAAQAEVDDALKWLNENNDADADAVRKRQGLTRSSTRSSRSATRLKTGGRDDGEAGSDDRFPTGTSGSFGLCLAREARDDRRFVVFVNGAVAVSIVAAPAPAHFLDKAIPVSTLHGSPPPVEIKHDAFVLNRQRRPPRHRRDLLDGVAMPVLAARRSQRGPSSPRNT